MSYLFLFQTITMKAYTLIKYGKAQTAFQLQDFEIPIPKSSEVVIKVSAFGLNYADVMARLGLYQDAPPLPCIIGYEVVGNIYQIGKDVPSNFKIGDRVTAMTRFGGYAEYAATDYRAIAKIGDMNQAKALALTTQYTTAYFASQYLTNIHKHDHVLIQAASGGVGTALVQMAKQKGCIIYGTASSKEKIDYLKKIGVDYPINYSEKDYSDVIKEIRGNKGLDIVFDSLGGKEFNKARKLLSSGGRIVAFGTASRSNSSNKVLSLIKLLFGFGFLNPVFQIANSKGIIGINMLKIADNTPHITEYCLQQVIQQAEKGILDPHIGGIFKHTELHKAHQQLENRKSIGKLVVTWDN